MKKLVKFVSVVVALTLIGIPSIKVVVRTVLADEPITTVQNTKEAVSLTEATETTTASTADNAVGVDTSASAEVNQVNQEQTQTSSVQLDENGKYTPNYKSINSKEDLDKMWDEAESNPSQFGGKGRVPEEPTPSEPSKPEKPEEPKPSEPEPSKPSEPSEPTPSKPEEPKSSSSEEPKVSSSESKEVKEVKKSLPTAGLPVTGEEKIVDYAMMATGFIILLFTMRYTTVIAFLKGKYKI